MAAREPANAGSLQAITELANIACDESAGMSSALAFAFLYLSGHADTVDHERLSPFALHTLLTMAEVRGDRSAEGMAMNILSSVNCTWQLRCRAALYLAVIGAPKSTLESAVSI